VVETCVSRLTPHVPDTRADDYILPISWLAPPFVFLSSVRAMVNRAAVARESKLSLGRTSMSVSTRGRTSNLAEGRPSVVLLSSASPAVGR